MDKEIKDTIIAELRELMSKAKYDEAKTDQFCNTVEEILQDVNDHPDEEREVKYEIRKHFDSIEFRLDISGEKIDPMTEGEGAEGRQRQKAKNSMLFNSETAVSATYRGGWNRITVRSPSKIANSKLLSEPMVKAMLLGIVAGVIVRFVPEGPRGVFLEGIASPIMSTVINLMMGVMGPAFFLFIIIVVSSLGDMDNLSKVGKVILKRFVLSTLWITVLTIIVAVFFFPVTGKSDTSVEIADIESALLSVLPENFISPFTECNIPQIILLGLIFGTALVMMGESGKAVRDALLKVKEWVMNVLMMMMKILPLIPFISTMLIVANGNAKVFIQGWKYIAAAYIVYIVSLLIEFIAISARCKRSVKDLAKILKDIAVMAFVTAMPAATMMQSYQVSERDFHIDRSFSDLWISLSMNLLSPARTVSLVLSVFFIADVSGSSINIALMIILIITAVQMSLTSSGTVAGATVMLETMKLPTDMVGLFSAFEIFTRNAGAAYDATYSKLEELDAARETGNINEGNEEAASAGTDIAG